MSETTLIDVQEDLAARLRADYYFSDIPVFTERKQDVASEINVALSTVTEQNGKAGTAVILQQVVGDDEYPDVPYGPMMFHLSAVVLENVLLNAETDHGGTGKPALETARRIHRVLKHYRPGGITQSLVPDKPCIAPVAIDPLLVSYVVKFSAQEADGAVFTKVQTPTVAPPGGRVPQTVTIRCVTEGATIYYTLDGSPPWPSNPTANVYSEPFEITEVKTLRVAATKTGSIPSDSVRCEFFS